jgi:hypothetical protein
VVAQAPQVAGLRPGLARRRLKGRLEVERLRALALLAGIERTQQVLHQATSAGTRLSQPEL